MIWNIQQIPPMLDEVTKGLRNETLTPATMIEQGTFVCFTEQINGAAGQYIQAYFDSMPENYRAMLLGKNKGEVIHNIKIIAVFNHWPANEVVRLTKGAIAS